MSEPTITGVARVVADLVTDQVHRGWHPIVACPPDGDLPRWTHEAGGAFEPWAATNRPGPRDLAALARLRRLVARVQPDVVHLHSSKAGMIGRLAIRGALPTLFQPHAWSFNAAHGPERDLVVRWERLAARWAHRIVCVSEGERDTGARHGVDGRWEVVPNAVDLDQFPAPAPDDRRLARERLGVPDSPLVVCVGRLHRQKGQDVLLDAWPHVLERVPEASLALVGDGPDRHALEARGVPGVRFTGWRDDVRRWVVAADVIAMPSRWEGMSLSLLESMASARSIVATDVDGMREVLGDDGERAGALIPLGDTGALVHALTTRLLDEQRCEDEGRLGRARVEQRYDATRWRETMARLVMDVTSFRTRTRPQTPLSHVR